MKNPTQHLLAAMILPAALLFIQCAPTPTKDAPPQAVAVRNPSQHWVMVSSQPPTFYPRGVAADCPTDCHSGEWVSTEDDRGTRFFIPFRGTPGGQRQGLVKEALALCTDRKRSRIAEEDKIKPVNVAVTAAAVPVALPVMAGIWLVAPWWYFRDQWKDGHP